MGFWRHNDDDDDDDDDDDGLSVICELRESITAQVKLLIIIFIIPSQRTHKSINK